MSTPLLLVYNLEGQAKLKLCFVCAELRLKIRSVPKSDYNQPLGALVGIRPRVETASADEDFSEEMLVMANFSSQQFHAFLDALRREKVPPIPLKAVLTPTNAGWNSLELRAELLREHEALHGKG